ncbi:MAG: hypothetical protein ACK2UL_05410, partial [Anaerolineae bacterium]
MSPDNKDTGPDAGRDTGEEAGSGAMRDAAPVATLAPLPFKHRKPEWLRVRMPGGGEYEEVHATMRGHGLHT